MNKATLSRKLKKVSLFFYSIGMVFLIAGLILNLAVRPVLADWDQSILVFQPLNCSGDCDLLQATVCNYGEGDMVGPSTFQVWWSPGADPASNGRLVHSGVVPALTVNQCTSVSFNPRSIAPPQNPYPIGTYRFLAVQHPESGLTNPWSGICYLKKDDCLAPTPTPTNTFTFTPTATITNTFTFTPTSTPTTPADTPTFTPTSTPTTPADTPTFTPTSTPTTPADTPTFTPTFTATTPADTPTFTPTFTPTTPADTPTFTPTFTPTPLVETLTPTATLEEPTATPTDEPTATPTDVVVESPTPVDTPPVDPTETPVITDVPGDTPTPIATDEPGPTPTDVPEQPATLPPPPGGTTTILIPVTGGNLAPSNPLPLVGGMLVHLGFVMLGIGLLMTGAQRWMR